MVGRPLFHRAVQSLGWAIRLRCPNCGSGRLHRTWFSMREACDRCGLRADRGQEDHFLGAMMLNLIVAELVCALAVIVLVVLTWPMPPWSVVLYGGALLAVGSPMIFYPFSKSLWLAVDLLFRPVRDADAEGPASERD